jgi:mRNA interferase MazF
VKRGEIWSVAAPSDYVGKPRPAVIVQNDDFGPIASVVICPFTSNEAEASLFRPLIETTAGNGLVASSRLMVDKLSAVPKTRLGKRIGRLSAADMLRLNRALMVFLGLAGS